MAKNISTSRCIKYVIGIDEAGRGPLAGPVSVGGIWFPHAGYSTFKKSPLRLPQGIDSKKLSAQDRDGWFETIRNMQQEGTIRYACSMVSAAVIDEIGIEAATRCALKRTLVKLDSLPEDTRVLLDGRLSAPKVYVQQETIIRGDEKELAIGLASIVAKVVRDKYMVRLARKYPEYDLEKHKGYGTRVHKEAIRIYGLTKIHRRSFIRN